jgi:hypothetical protein
LPATRSITKDDTGVIRWKNPQRAPQVKVSHRDRTGCVALAQQQRRNQEPAEDEEGRDPIENRHEAAMCEHHTECGHRAEAIEHRQMPRPDGLSEISRGNPRR